MRNLRRKLFECGSCGYKSYDGEKFEYDSHNNECVCEDCVEKKEHKFESKRTKAKSRRYYEGMDDIDAEYEDISIDDDSSALSQSSLPAFAPKSASALSTICSKIVNTPRKRSIRSTIEAMGFTEVSGSDSAHNGDFYINKMNNIVVNVPDFNTASAVLGTIYQQFGVKGSFMVTWEGNGKLYFSPTTPVEKTALLNYSGPGVDSGRIDTNNSSRYLLGK